MDVSKEEQNTAGKSTKSVVSKTNWEDPLAKLQISELKEGVHSHCLYGDKIGKQLGKHKLSNLSRKEINIWSKSILGEQTELIAMNPLSPTAARDLDPS